MLGVDSAYMPSAAVIDYPEKDLELYGSAAFGGTYLYQCSSNEKRFPNGLNG